MISWEVKSLDGLDFAETGVLEGGGGGKIYQLSLNPIWKTCASGMLSVSFV